MILALMASGILLVGAVLLWWNARGALPGEEDGVADPLEAGTRMDGFLKAWLWILGISATFFGSGIWVGSIPSSCSSNFCLGTPTQSWGFLLGADAVALFGVGTVVIGTIALLRSIDRQTFRGRAPSRRGRR